MTIRNTFMGVILVLLVFTAGGKLYSMKGPYTDSLPEGHSFGLNSGLLAPCRKTPNCVCTDHKGHHYIEPVSIDRSGWARLRENPDIMKGCRLVVSEQGYLRFECRSAFFGFIDDVELLYDENAGLLRFRSAARLGYSDLGVNRKRMERLRSFLARGE